MITNNFKNKSKSVFLMCEMPINELSQESQVYIFTKSYPDLQCEYIDPMMYGYYIGGNLQEFNKKLSEQSLEHNMPQEVISYLKYARDSGYKWLIFTDSKDNE